MALLRLFCLFSVGCYLALETGLWVRAAQETGLDLVDPLPTASISTPQLPFLGINVVLEQYSAKERAAALKRLHQHGFGWVRQRLDWGEIEPTAGHYDWRASDAIIHAMIAAGLVPVLVLDGSPAWARAPEDIPPTDNPLAPPADPATFARFAAAFATRYQETVRFYQIWDEPNIAPHWGNHWVEPVAYAQLLKATATAIRTADPNAVIITAALAPTADRGHQAIDEVYFLQRLYAAGAAPFFDVVATQPFGFGYGPHDPRARPNILNFQRVKWIRRAMLTAGDEAKPIWAVRYGWNTYSASPWRTVIPSDQLTFATEALTLTRQQWPWLTAMGWAIDQPATSRTDPRWGFALTDDLADAFHTWQSSPTISSANEAAIIAVHPPNRWDWVLLATLWLVVGWRTSAALLILPWPTWRQRYASRPIWQQVGAWVVLAILYNFATWPPLLALCWIAAILLILTNPITGLGLVALVLPFYFQHKEITLVGDTLVMPPAHAALFCLGLALLVQAIYRFLEAEFSNKRVGSRPVRFWKPDRSTVDWLALLWIILSLLTTVNVWHWPAYGEGLLNLAGLPVLAYVATRRLVTTPTRQTGVMAALFTGGLLAALLGLTQWGQGEGTIADGVLRVVGPYFSPNHLALYLERTWWLGAGLLLQSKGALRRWLGVACGVIGVALFLTASRGAWLLALPAGALLFGWLAGADLSGFWKPDRFRIPKLKYVLQGLRRCALSRHTVVSGITLAVLLVVMLGLRFINPLWARFTNSATMAERWSIWQATFHLWQDHWLLGLGPGGFFWRYPSYLEWSAQSDPNLLHPHNLWLELLAGWGLLGLLWFLLLLWQVGRMAYTVKLGSKERPPWPLFGLLAALAAGMAHGQVDTFTSLPDLAVWNWLVLGLLVNGKATADSQ